MDLKEWAEAFVQWSKSIGSSSASFPTMKKHIYIYIYIQSQFNIIELTHVPSISAQFPLDAHPEANHNCFCDSSSSTEKRRKTS